MNNIFNPTTPKARSKMAWLVVGLLIIASSAVSGVRSMTDSSSSPFGSFMGAPSHMYPETYLEGEGSDKIVVINIEGTLVDTPSTNPLSAGGNAPIRQIIEQINQAAQDPLVKTILVAVNSPGGTVTASQMIHEKLLEAKDEGKKVVVLMREVAASGGYYIAAAADKIIANPSTVTGSIGVIMQMANLEELYEKVGYRPITFKAGALKDIGSSDRPMTEEERTIIQNLLNEEHNRFKKIVADGRKMDEAKVNSLADGRIYSGEQAKNNGLVDELGNMAKAIQISKDIAGLSDAQVVEYSIGLDIITEFFSKLSGTSQVNQLLKQLTSATPVGPTGIMYLWQPS